MAFWRNKVTKEMIQMAKDSYSGIAAIPTCDSVNFVGGEKIKSVWSQTSPELGKKRKFVRFFVTANLSPSGSPVPLGSESFKSVAIKNGSEVVISKQKSEATGNDVHILEVWTDCQVAKTINLTGVDKHGDVYFDSELGCLVANPSGTKVAFVAEAKKPKDVPFFPSKNEEDGEVFPGQEFVFKEDFGEQLVGKVQPVVVVVDLESGRVDTFLDDSRRPDNEHPGQLEWINDGELTGVLVVCQPVVLGLIYCVNRPTRLFRLDVATGLATVIRGEANDLRCHSPKRCPDGSGLVWLENDLSKIMYPGPHGAIMRLVKMDDKTGAVDVLVDKVSGFDPDTNKFAGLTQTLNMPNHFSSSGHFVTNCIVGHTNFPCLVDPATKSLHVVHDSANITVRDVYESTVVATKEDPLTPPVIVLGKIDGVNIKWTALHEPAQVPGLPDGSTWKTFTHKPSNSPIKYNSIYIGPGSGEPKSTPLIAMPHGGPHSVMPTSFYGVVAHFLAQGFACLMLNYRGSLGHGEDSLNSLLGNVGDNDVKDCQQAKNEVLAEFRHLDPEKVGLFGGSHGGFLVTHLAGQYPKDYKAVIARNPVINMASMVGITDIPDWAFNESGIPFSYKTPTAQELDAMLHKSPIVYADRVEASVMLMIGRADLRAPPSQGREYFRALKAAGKTNVDMNLYDDNHPLAKVVTNTNVLINSALFFKASFL